MDVTLPIRTVNELNGSHGHWSKVRDRRKNIRGDARLCVMQRGRPQLPVIVLMTRVSAGELDDDGLRAALKSVRDGIADAYGIADNDPAIVWEYAQARGARCQYEVRIQITPAVECRETGGSDG